jgi:hypothetical protein
MLNFALFFFSLQVHLTTIWTTTSTLKTTFQTTKRVDKNIRSWFSFTEKAFLGDQVKYIFSVFQSFLPLKGFLLCFFDPLKILSKNWYQYLQGNFNIHESKIHKEFQSNFSFKILEKNCPSKFLDKLGLPKKKAFNMDSILTFHHMLFEVFII